MPVREAINSPTPNKDGTISRTWTVWGTIDDAQAEAEAYAAASPTYRGLIRVGRPDGRVTARGIWEFEFTYGILPDDEPSDDGPTLGTLELNSSGGTQHITQALQSEWYPSDGSNNDALATSLSTAKVIGFHKDGVNGVDIDIPGATITLTRKFLPHVITGDYLQNLVRLRGHINYYNYTIAWAYGSQAYSMTFEPAELRFGNARASIGRTSKGLSCWDISYEFIHSANVYNLEVGNGVLVPFKGGHHYLWHLYRRKEVVGAILEVPDYTFQSRVYDWADFAYYLGF